jgi:hypothetical protein
VKTSRQQHANNPCLDDTRARGQGKSLGQQLLQVGLIVRVASHESNGTVQSQRRRRVSSAVSMVSTTTAAPKKRMAFVDSHGPTNRFQFAEDAATAALSVKYPKTIPSGGGGGGGGVEYEVPQYDPLAAERYGFKFAIETDLKTHIVEANSAEDMLQWIIALRMTIAAAASATRNSPSRFVPRSGTKSAHTKSPSNGRHLPGPSPHQRESVAVVNVQVRSLRTTACMHAWMSICPLKLLSFPRDVC